METTAIRTQAEINQQSGINQRHNELVGKINKLERDLALVLELLVKEQIKTKPKAKG